MSNSVWGDLIKGRRSLAAILIALQNQSNEREIAACDKTEPNRVVQQLSILSWNG